MRLGRYRDHFPRVPLVLPGAAGPVRLEFVLDTGFEGELAVPPAVLRRLDADLVGREVFALANGTRLERDVYEILLDWNDEERVTQVLALDGSPLLGTLLLEGNQVRIEAEEGGEVLIEQL